MTEAGAKAWAGVRSASGWVRDIRGAAMTSGVLVDTSFLITLADPNRPRHKVAEEYFRHFLSERMPMALSAIVVSEFHMRQNIKTLPLENFILLPFNHDDATAAADLNFKKYHKAGTDRVALKDDFKLLGQAKARRFGYLITDDAETLHPICEELQAAGRTGDPRHQAAGWLRQITFQSSRAA